MAENSKLFGLILAGGSGTRLWPLSRKELPKQFLRIEGEHTLLQNTLLRLKTIIDPQNIRVVAGDEWAALINYQAGEVGCEGDIIIREPEGRNTAPAIALGISYLLAGGAKDTDVALVCPSDHIISDTEAFRQAVKNAVKSAKTGQIVTFGVVPTFAETGFGYIKTAAGAKHKNRYSLKVERFVEKPNKETAENYLKDGNYHWNGGIFCFRLRDMLDALVKYFPECGVPASSGLKELQSVFRDVTSTSIDYAVMEKASNVTCVPLDAGWSDVGSWDAVYDNLKRDENDNAAAGDVMLDNVHNSLVFSHEKLTAAVDLDDVIAVDTPDALFIAKRGSSQKVREIVKQLKDEGRKEEYQATESARPWGTYKILSEDKHDKVKQITVLPHKRLSLQYHEHRSEHWVVIKGTAKVTLIDNDNREKINILTLTEGESCFVAKRRLHRLENAMDKNLEIIEVQTGDYVGEDDITRVDDDYARSVWRNGK